MIDAHCHLDLFPNPKSVVDACLAKQMSIVSVTTTPSAFRGTLKLASSSPLIRTALGLHPQLAEERYRELALFNELVGSVQWVGEIGLDGTPEFKSSRIKQEYVFRYILERCSEVGGRILSIHSRGAAAAVLDQIISVPDCGVPVFHWFSGSRKDLLRAIDLGCWFSVGLPMLRSQKGRAIVEAIPVDRLLTESDAPFVQIHDIQYPADLGETVIQLAELWKCSTKQVENQLQTNYGRLNTSFA